MHNRGIKYDREVLVGHRSTCFCATLLISYFFQPNKESIKWRKERHFLFFLENISKERRLQPSWQMSQRSK